MSSSSQSRQTEDAAPAAGWIAAQLQSSFGALARAKAHLAGQGYSAYAPLYDPGPIVDRRNHIVPGAPRPLFPGYVFVLMTPGKSWHPVRSTKGVLDLVCFGDRVAIIPDACITEIRSRERSDGLVDLAIGLKPGDRVTVTRGVFAGWEGVYEQTDDRLRVHILLDMMRQSVRIVASRGSVEPVAPERPRLR